MAMGSSCPWIDHEKNVCARLAATICSLVMRVLAVSTPIGRPPLLVGGITPQAGRATPGPHGRSSGMRPRGAGPPSVPDRPFRAAHMEPGCERIAEGPFSAARLPRDRRRAPIAAGHPKGFEVAAEAGEVVDRDVQGLEAKGSVADALAEVDPDP